MTSGRPQQRVVFICITPYYMIFSGLMGKTEKTISFRAEAGKINALDSLAAAQDRPRSYLINEAISNYIDLHAYQDALVRNGLEQMKRGRTVSHEQVIKRFRRRAGRVRT